MNEQVKVRATCKAEADKASKRTTDGTIGIVVGANGKDVKLDAEQTNAMPSATILTTTAKTSTKN